MVRISRLLPLLLLLVLAPDSPFAKGNANFILGSRSFDEDEWAPVEEHDVFGARVDFGSDDWPVTIVVGALASSADETFMGLSVELEVAEFSVGVQKTWDQFTHARPFLSGGLASVTADVTGSLGPISVGEDDSSGAIFGEGGVYWRIGARFNLGVHARFVAGTDLTIGGVDTDADYTQAGALIGWGW